MNTWDKQTRSISSGKGQRNVSTQLSRESILEVSDLSSLPRQRAVFIGAGVRPVLVKTIPWFEQPALSKRLNTAYANSTQVQRTAADKGQAVTVGR